MIPFREFAPALHATGCHFRPTLVLHAYFDETGTHSGSPLVSILGLIGTEDAWKDAEQKWIFRKDKDSVEKFHSFDCNHGKGEFSGSDWKRPRRDVLMSDLAKIVGDSELHQLGFSLPLRAWEKVNDQKFKERYQNPYHFCFEHAVMAANLWSEDFANREPVAIVFAHQDEYAEMSKIFAEILPGLGSLEGVASIAFSTPQKMVPLQMADLVAYTVGRRWLRGKSPLTPLEQKLLGKNKESKQLFKTGDAAFLLRIAEANRAGQGTAIFHSQKWHAYLQRRVDEQARQERKGWGLLSTVKAAINKFKRRR
jgi:hypothetical protein